MIKHTYLTKDQTLQGNEFYDGFLKDLSFSEETIKHKSFENCRFESCHFNEATLHSCKFIDCEFIGCDMSCVKLIHSTFSETVFVESKLTGINWTQAKWPNIALDSPIKFYQCNVSHSSFYELDLSGFVLEQCKAHEVDFRGVNLSHGSFVLSDLTNSLFMNNNLQSADFTDAMSYVISPLENNIKQAKFSSPEVLNLLLAFDIDIR